MYESVAQIWNLPREWIIFYNNQNHLFVLRQKVAFHEQMWYTLLRIKFATISVHTEQEILSYVL